MRDENRVSLLHVVLTLAFPEGAKEKLFLVSLFGNGIYCFIETNCNAGEKQYSTGFISTSICLHFFFP